MAQIKSHRELEYEKAAAERAIRSYERCYKTRLRREARFIPLVFEPSPKNTGNLLAFEGLPHGERGRFLGTVFQKSSGNWSFVRNDVWYYQDFPTQQEAQQALSDLCETYYWRFIKDCWDD